METWILFGILSIPIVIISWRTLFDIKSHGFYRFFSWECILWLCLANYKYWFDHPFSLTQIISWILLFYSIYPVVAGAVLLKKARKPATERDEKSLYQFEKTSELIDYGIFKYIRHPLYSSLLFLTWGIFFKHISVSGLLVAMISSVFLFLTARFDEKECIQFFGDQYIAYMKRSKMFIPFLF